MSLTGKRVVVCEDEGVTQLQIRRILTRAGAVVVGAAGNGEEAVATILRERPDLVIMDVRMPLLDGIAATRRIREVYPVCILIVTAYASEETQEQARLAGASGYLVKPITGDVLLSALQAAFEAFEQRSG